MPAISSAGCPSSVTLSTSQTSWVSRWPDRLGPKVGQIGPKWDKDGEFFQIRFSTFWLDEPKCTESDLKKSGFVPVGANTTHLRPK